MPMSANNVILRFDNVTFGYDERWNQLQEASFSVRENSKITIMGQNGAGKSTLFKLILGRLTPKKGEIHLTGDAMVAIAEQTMAEEHLPRTVREYFETAFPGDVPHNLDQQIDSTLSQFGITLPLERKIKDCSGGQKARLLLAHALIQKPDILLLDEPTNNLDAEGIGYLTAFLMMYEKTVLVISHDADFLNSFTEGVLNLDVHTRKVEQYVGNYSDVVEEIKARVEREEKKNAQLKKEIQDKKDKINFFSHKGGKMRKLASKMREEVAEAEENMVDVKRDDKTIGKFEIEAEHYKEVILKMDSVTIMKDLAPASFPVNIELRRGMKMKLEGPNGIGKTTLLEGLANGTAPGATLGEKIHVGYYRQDFSGLDFGKTGFDSLAEVMGVPVEEDIYRTAANFLLSSEMLRNPVGSYSEGQKGLLSFARFVLMKPALLILDEPSNHINFRHLPIIAKALHNYQGAMIIVSHMDEFIKEIGVDTELDLGRFLSE